MIDRMLGQYLSEVKDKLAPKYRCPNCGHVGAIPAEKS